MCPASLACLFLIILPPLYPFLSFFFNNPATPEIYTLSLHDALPISPHPDNAHAFIDYILRPDIIAAISNAVSYPNPNLAATPLRSEEHTSEFQSRRDLVCRLLLEKKNIP